MKLYAFIVGQGEVYVYLSRQFVLEYMIVTFFIFAVEFDAVQTNTVSSCAYSDSRLGHYAA